MIARAKQPQLSFGFVSIVDGYAFPGTENVSTESVPIGNQNRGPCSYPRDRQEYSLDGDAAHAESISISSHGDFAKHIGRDRVGVFRSVGLYQGEENWCDSARDCTDYSWFGCDSNGLESNR